MGGAWQTAKCAGKSCGFSVSFSAPPRRLVARGGGGGGLNTTRRGRRAGKVKISPLGAPRHDEASLEM